MDIEDISAEKPESIVRSTVEPAVGLQDFQCRQIAFQVGYRSGTHPKYG
jgi:succinyl-CoA synthetase beta subunit/malate-CoA ligase subunit beta